MSLARLRHSNLKLLAMVGAALLMRALIPAGWMPAHGAHGFALELCSGRTPGGDAEQLRAARALLEAALAGTSQGQSDNAKSDASDQPCAFAGLAHAAPPAIAPESPSPTPQASAIQPLALVAAIGRGLPAPPPPATGPPLLA